MGFRLSFLCPRQGQKASSVTKWDFILSASDQKSNSQGYSTERAENKLRFRVGSGFSITAPVTLEM